MAARLTGWLRALRGRLPSTWLSPAEVQDVRETLSFLRAGAQWLGLCFVIDRFLVHASLTHGPSMMPTLNEMGDVIIVDRLSPRLWAPIARGDIVVADSSYKPDFTVCKRVIALPGDVVSVARPPGEGFLDSALGGGGGGSWVIGLPAGAEVVVPAGHVWLEGDNTLDSVDSRYYGPVPAGLIKGRAVARIWPLWAAQWMDRDSAPRPAANSAMRLAMAQDSEVVLAAGMAVSARRAAVAQRDSEALAEQLRRVAVEREGAVLQRAVELAALLSEVGNGKMCSRSI